MWKSNSIIVSDSRDLSKLSANKVALTVTSPPYHNAINYQEHQDTDGWYRGTVTTSLEEWIEDMRKVFSEVYRVTKPGGFCCIVIGNEIIENKNKLPLPALLLVELTKKEIGWNFFEEIIWNKVTGGKKRFRVTVQHPYPTYYYPNIMHEQILILRKLPFHNIKDKKSKLIINDLMKKEIANSVWHIAPMPPSYRKFHPAAFPEEIPYRLIQLYSNVGDLVLDPFVGSGQTTKMARFLNRKYIGVDKSPKYVKIAQKRTLEKPSLRKLQLVPNWKVPEPL
ncbi:putative type II DNA modification methylase [Nitrosotalea sinensis]|jgi:site-specific DNA-methyltransferase (adenine-specific)|uniref:Type II methyltransferase n=1 Tax=Nitrosotalea sinensis TaxID=1499975 RepID=A0A2H1EJ84_9ARCH|nr:site-specific DNA-methyltransferase [Candidatus Nitrosotalea sinensis]SHO47902.1 putative type II DNA modification methylase [Candidatus Nitrosotalea sinensis]